MMRVKYIAVRCLHDQALLVALLLITGFVNASLSTAAAAEDAAATTKSPAGTAEDPDSPTVFVAVGKTVAIRVRDDGFSVVWPEETGNVQDAASNPEVLSVVRMEKLNGVATFFVTGKSVGTASLVCTYKTAGQPPPQGVFNCTVHVKQDDDRVNKILKSYNEPNGADLKARSYGTGERVVIEGVTKSPAQMSAILAQLPNKHLLREHIVVNVKYKCQCYCCTHGIGGTHEP